MKVVILEKLDDNTYIVMSDDGQTSIVNDEEIKRLRKIGNLREPDIE